MARFKNNDIAHAIYEATKDKKGAELNAVLANVVKFLSRHRLLGKKDLILNSLKKIENREEGNLEVVIKSKNKVKPESLAHILHFLKHNYNAKNVETTEEIDEDVIGGMKIQIGDEIIDLTLQNQLNQLQAQLLKN